MKFAKILFLFLLISILFSSVVTLLSSQRSLVFSTVVSTSPHTSLFIPASLILETVICDNLPPLNQSTRIAVYNFVKANPGVHFRGICTSLNLPIGVAQYHLGLLTKAGLISFFRDGRYKRYFCSKKFGENEMKILSLLRHRTTGKILSILSTEEPLSHTDLASRVKISSQALTWHISLLKEKEFIDLTSDGVRVKYSLDGKNVSAVKRCLRLTS